MRYPCSFSLPTQEILKYLAFISHLHFNTLLCLPLLKSLKNKKRKKKIERKSLLTLWMKETEWLTDSSLIPCSILYILYASEKGIFIWHIWLNIMPLKRRFTEANKGRRHVIFQIYRLSIYPFIHPLFFRLKIIVCTSFDDSFVSFCFVSFRTHTPSVWNTFNCGFGCWLLCKDRLNGLWVSYRL